MKWVALLGLLAVVPAVASEEQVRLQEAEGRTRAEAHCSMCHSLDYIPLNAGILDRKGWEASVNKMIKVMGAPIPAGEVPALVDYLTRNYGKQ